MSTEIKQGAGAGIDNRDSSRENIEENLAHVSDLLTRAKNATDDETKKEACKELAIFIITKLEDDDFREIAIDNNTRNLDRLARVILEADEYVFLGTGTRGTRVRFKKEGYDWEKLPDKSVGWMSYAKPGSEEQHYMKYHERFIAAFGSDYVTLFPELIN